MSWRLVFIPEVLFYQEGPGVRNTQFTEQGVKLLNVGNINAGKLNLDATKIYISDQEAYGKYSHFLVDEGDLLIASSGIVVDNFHNKITFAKAEHLPLCMNTSTIRFRSLNNEILNIEFFSHFLKTNFFTKQLSRLITGSAQLNFGPSHLKQIQMALPPINIQKQIAKILGKADTLRKKDKQLLQYYDDLAQSLFIDMFGDPVRNEKGWPQKSLGSACVKITDGTHFSPPSQASGVPYITAKHVRKNKVDFFNNPTYVTQEDHEAIYSRCTPVKGDVLYIKDGATTGIAAINNYDFEFSMLSSLALIKVNKQVLNNYFLAHWLNNENIKENYIRNYMAGAAIRRFTLDKIKRFEILIPPITLQNKFATQIQNIEQQKEKLKLQMQESENLFQSLLQKAFNGDLN